MRDETKDEWNENYVEICWNERKLFAWQKIQCSSASGGNHECECKESIFKASQWVRMWNEIQKSSSSSSSALKCNPTSSNSLQIANENAKELITLSTTSHAPHPIGVESSLCNLEMLHKTFNHFSKQRRVAASSRWEHKLTHSFIYISSVTSSNILNIIFKSWSSSIVADQRL